MLRIIEAGFNSSLQDAGRKGFRHLGVATDGPADAVHFELANILAGNKENTPAIELIAGTLRLCASCDLLLAIVGQGFELSHENDQTRVNIPINWQTYLKKNESLSIRQIDPAGICYIAVAGGFSAEKYMGSSATNLTLKRGGHRGRALKRNDILECEAISPEQYSWGLRGVRAIESDSVLRAMTGPEHDELPQSLTSAFWENDWQMGNERSRMGVRVSRCTHHNETRSYTMPENTIKSHAVIPGTVQLTTPENAVILGPGCQTTGGYFRIAKVIDADLWKIAHLNSGEPFRLKQVSEIVAISALEERKQLLFRCSISAAKPIKSAEIIELHEP